MDQKRAGITISLKLEFAKALTWIKNIWKEYKKYRFVYTKYRLKLWNTQKTKKLQTRRTAK